MQTITTVMLVIGTLNLASLSARTVGKGQRRDLQENIEPIKGAERRLFLCPKTIKSVFI